MDNKKMEDNRLQINLSPEVADGTYANLAIIAHSPSEFVIDFARVTPNTMQANVKSRIIMTPEHAKRLLMALQENVRKYEQQFGAIAVHNTVPSGTIPMSFGGGEA
ncbi:MAG: DUF3467 domain-containing protein [Paludibacter sp.]|nr:DUF3467 domain-containing protein [Bacteroidales bacterium]MCM1068329.1 DUF3467 domain-containing protein [Prevotella sp.]MCM1354043.1 DUF3467 domain-containing protein [Bacteroides sp.]MCM1442115.1 DUF3467 domain-containing protein [Muribaculum sp.]MCM1481992.1 DUF3467 domain-containing protein [Paludibacter sp.]